MDTVRLTSIIIAVSLTHCTASRSSGQRTVVGSSIQQTDAATLPTVANEERDAEPVVFIPSTAPIIQTCSSSLVYPPNSSLEVIEEGVRFRPLFNTNGDRLHPTSFPLLEELVLFIQQNPECHFEVQGHLSFNPDHESPARDLSERRASSVRRYLVTRGIAEARLSHRGYRDNRPIAGRGTDPSGSINRRIEVVRLP